MNKNIQRLGIGRLNIPAINQDTSVINPVPGIFTFDSTIVRFDSMVDTFDFDIVALPDPNIPKRDYKIADYSQPDYK
jgi:hypothetical protein